MHLRPRIPLCIVGCRFLTSGCVTVRNLTEPNEHPPKIPRRLLHAAGGGCRPRSLGGPPAPGPTPRPGLRRRPIPRPAPAEHRRGLRRSGDLRRNRSRSAERPPRSEFLRMGALHPGTVRMRGREPPVHPIPAIRGRDPRARAQPLRVPGSPGVRADLFLGALPDRHRFPAAEGRTHGVRGSGRNRPRSLRRTAALLAHDPFRERPSGGDSGKGLPRALGGRVAPLRRRVRRVHGSAGTIGDGPFRRSLHRIQRNQGFAGGVAALALPAPSDAPSGSGARRIPASS